MKEFIDKLISRLEEKEKRCHDMALAEIMNNGHSRDAEHLLSQEDTYSNIIRIVNELAEETDKGNISDGYHTFNELYHHRAVLFSVICNSNKDKAWKSKLHDTGDMYEGMFIVGIETPEGQATYHYDINPYWDMFNVKELPKAPKWDGHTPNEAIRRIGLLAEEYINTSTEHINCSTDISTTNADRIRSMTDEELAEFLENINTGWDISYGNYISMNEGVFISDRKDLLKEILKWLQSEAE